MQAEFLKVKEFNQFQQIVQIASFEKVSELKFRAVFRLQNYTDKAANIDVEAEITLAPNYPD